MTISANRFLTLAEMSENAAYIMGKLLGKGWTKQAVSGLLGNLQSESTINPGIWQGLHSYDSTPYITVAGAGYGLVQWTPFNKFTVWARDKGWDYHSIDAQIERIQYEVDNNLQWFGGFSAEMNFLEFTRSTANPDYLAEVFIKTYEHPADPEQPARGTQALYWFEHLTGETVPPEEPPPNDGIDVYAMLLAGTLRGWND